MILKKIEIKPGNAYRTNCYIVADDETKEAMVVDPGGEPEKILQMIDVLEVNVKYIVLTHCHGDHISGVPQVKEKTGAKVLIFRSEAEVVNNPNVNLIYFVGLEEINIEVDSRLDDGDLIHIGNLEFQVIHTPGHTAGCICLYNKEYKMLLSGDTLFSGTWGRTDLPTSSFEDIINSITNKLMILPEETIVYPGHGRPTIIKDEEKVYLNLKPRG